MSYAQDNLIRGLPGDGIKIDKMPGHWVLARLGKRVLRPGGREMTQRMLDKLAIGCTDNVVEFAPGLGATARQVMGLRPASYIGVERDVNAAARLDAALHSSNCRVLQGEAGATCLPETSATVVYGEAMLTMQPNEVKRRIVREASRLLRPGGRYAIHEICFTTESEAEQANLRYDLSQVIHHGVQPMTAGSWRALLESEGF